MPKPAPIPGPHPRKHENPKFPRGCVVSHTRMPGAQERNQRIGVRCGLGLILLGRIDGRFFRLCSVLCSKFCVAESWGLPPDQDKGGLHEQVCIRRNRLCESGRAQSPDQDPGAWPQSICAVHLGALLLNITKAWIRAAPITHRTRAVAVRTMESPRIVFQAVSRAS